MSELFRSNLLSLIPQHDQPIKRLVKTGYGKRVVALNLADNAKQIVPPFHPRLLINGYKKRYLLEGGQQGWVFLQKGKEVGK